MSENDYKYILKQFHILSDRHVLTVETDMSVQEAMKVKEYSDKVRKAGNELVGIMRKNYEQLLRTKKYRRLLALYGGTEDEKKRKKYGKQLKQMQEKYDVTFDFCRTAMQKIRVKYNIDAVFGLTKAEDVWRGIEKCLYDTGKTIHFAGYGDFPCIRAKQTNRGITISSEDNKLKFRFCGIRFGIKVNDRFQSDEVKAVLNYLDNAEAVDKRAVDTFTEYGCAIDTYRPCYASLVVRRIRKKYRVFLHLTIEGKAVPKYDRNGLPRHKFGQGMVGADIGTQTVAYTSDTEVGLKNLAERGNNITKSERLERRYYRAMDRSRRATNPDNYNEDDTIRKGKKVWHYSNHYKELKYRHSELCRKNAINRHLANNEEANHLRSLGDTLVTEPKNAAKLAKRAKETTVNEKGKFNRKKRYGKSIQNRCPGGFQATLEKKFSIAGGTYIEVPYNYRASQYDHTADDYIRKGRNVRMYHLQDGTLVQRDWYSSFLLYCCDSSTQDINKAKCKGEFDEQYEKEKALIGWIKRNRIKVMNSGIKV